MKRSLKIVLIIASVALVVSVATSVIAIVFMGNGSNNGTVDTLGYGELAEPSDLTDGEKIAGYANVLDYGAKPGDNGDDTAAFEAAIKKNIAVYVPAGKYIVSRPLPFNDQNFFGDGVNATQIVSVMTDATKPMFYLGGSSTLSDMTVGYSDKLITGSEKRGERVAVSCGAAIGFGPGGGIKDAAFKNVGTAVYSDSTDGYGTSNCAFARISVEGFTNCGFDFICKAGYGNVFKQITAIASKGEGVFTFSGVGGSDMLENITVKDCKLQYAVGYTELAGVMLDTPVCSQSDFSKSVVYKLEEQE